jgi:GNAT superfamily N-acetyltransferase
MVKPDIHFRDATLDDVPRLVQMLVDDSLGKLRENADLPLDQCYIDAFSAMDSDPNHRLVVVTRSDVIVGMLQLSYLPGLSRMGAWRGQIESVRVAASERGQGIGKVMFEWAIEQSRERGCNLVQLTSDIQRTEAHRFYAALGFTASHAGYKLRLE